MERVIWTMWWQGEDRAPLSVKLSIASMRRFGSGAEVIVLSEENYRQYADIPNHILDLYRRRRISLTHLSEVLHFQVVHDRGGLWIDSNVLFTEDIPEAVFSLELYTLNHKVAPETAATNITQGRWCSFFIGGTRGNALFDVASKFYLTYWKEHDMVPDYFLVDYVIELCSESCGDVRDERQAVPPCGGYIFDLGSRWAEPAGTDSIDGMFQKISCKVHYQANIDGQRTLFGNVLEEYGMLSDDAESLTAGVVTKQKLAETGRWVLLGLLAQFWTWTDSHEGGQDSAAAIQQR